MKRITERIKKSYWLRSGVLTFLQRISITLFGFFSFVILVRLLDVADFGTWVLYVSFVSVIELVREGFVKNPLIRQFVAANKEDHSFITGSSFVLNLSLFVFLSVIVAIVAKPISLWMDAPSLELLCYLYIIHSFFYTFFLHYNALHEANLNYQATFWSFFSQKLLFLLYPLSALLFGDLINVNLTNLALIQIAAVALSAGVSFWLAQRYAIEHFRYRWIYIKSIFNHGKYSFGTNMSSMILNNIDSWMLGGMVSPVAVAIYNPALRITRLVEVPMSSVASITYPKLVHKDREYARENAKKLYEKSVAAILATMIPIVIGTIVFAKPIVWFIAGEGYEEAAPILQIVVLYGLIAPFNRQFGNTLDAIGQARLTFHFVLASAVLNTVLNYYMIQKYGILGAALATITTHFIGFFIRQYFLNQLLGVSFIKTLDQTIAWYILGMGKATKLYFKIVSR